MKKRLYRTVFIGGLLLSSLYGVSEGTDLVLAQTDDTTPEEKEGQEDITVTASVDRNFHYGEHGLLDVHIENKSTLSIDRISADLSEVGGSDNLSISPELNRVTLSVDYTVEPGEYTFPVTVWDESNGYYQTETSVTILPRDKAADEKDWDEEVIYFMLTDRFADGDSSNNNPYGLDYAGGSNDRGVYQGGDFKGVTDNLAYLSDLGITTIWLTPIVENVGYDVEHASSAGSYYGYHGYWAKNFEELNPHLGTLEEFHTLIDEAADLNIKIMVDVVLNHAGYGMNVSEGEEYYPEGFPTEEERALFSDMIREIPGRDDETMELSGLPDFETENEAVREQLVEWQASWIERSTTPKGNRIASYRVDTVKHVDRVTWQHFKNELVARDPSFKLIGEVWGAAYQGTHGYLKSGSMDSLLDFGFKDIASSFIGGRLERANQQLIDRNPILTSDATLGQFLGSHDEAGFLFTNRNDKGKLKLAASLQATAKGQPVIYYGEELGQSGAENWPIYDNRYDFAWDLVEENDVLAHYQSLYSFRDIFSDVLSRGNRELLFGSDEEEWIMVERSLGEESVYLAFNVSKEAQMIHIPVDSTDAILTDHYSEEIYEAEGNEIQLTIPSIEEGGTALLSIAEGKIVKEGDKQAEESTEVVESDTNSDEEREEKGFISRILSYVKEFFSGVFK